MAVLEKSIQDKIDDISTKSYEFYEKGNKKKSYELMEQAWELYPDPPENWNESYNTARYALDDALEDREIIQAEKWLNRMIRVHENLGGWEGSVEFYAGKFYFEKKEYAEAKIYFDISVKEGKGFRYFEGEDAKYRDFYLHPEKYIKSE